MKTRSALIMTCLLFAATAVAGPPARFDAQLQGFNAVGAPVQATDPAGPPVIWFFGGPPPSGGNAIAERINGSLARGYINADSDLTDGTLADLVAAIREGRATIVVHTTQNAAGELRGTLR